MSRGHQSGMRSLKGCSTGDKRTEVECHWVLKNYGVEGPSSILDDQERDNQRRKSLNLLQRQKRRIVDVFNIDGIVLNI